MSEGFDGSTAELEAEIQRMEKEKEELEKKNRDRQLLEQRLKQLKGNVSSLKSGKNSSQSGSRNSGDNQTTESVLNTSLEDSQSRIRTLQESLLQSPLGSTSFREEEEPNRSFEEVDDDVMTVQHKQALRENRDVLVENMTPDDIFNDLISRKILSNADVSRIKEKNTVEAINEELLNILVRRSDRAFTVFVSSLRRTLQGWLANRLDPPKESKGKRKRRTGELNVDVECERVLPRNKKRSTCTCREVEEQMLVMAKVAFFHIRRRDGTAAAFEQFKKELHQTNEALKDSMEILHSLKILCRHGELSDLSEGSVRFTIRCASFASCQRLWEDYKSGRILQAVKKGVITPSFLRICGAKKICLRVRISKLEYLTCALELGYLLKSSKSRWSQERVTRKVRNKPRQLCTSGKNENSFFNSDPGIRLTSQRRVFKEISPNILTVDKLSGLCPNQISEVGLSRSGLHMCQSQFYDTKRKYYSQKIVDNDSSNIIQNISGDSEMSPDLHGFQFSRKKSSLDEISCHSPIYKTRSKTVIKSRRETYHHNTAVVFARKKLNCVSGSSYNLRCRSIRT